METETNVTSENQTQSFLAIQDYLSIGYVFLLVLGVFHETIYYKYLDVNILEYSSILDVLISPIALIFGNLFLLLTVLFVILVGYGYFKLIPKYYKWLGTKKKYQEGKYKLKLEKFKAMQKNKNGPLLIISIYVFVLFIGLGVGRGYKTKDKIDNGEYKMSHRIMFDDGEQKKIKMLGKNSLYVFYVTEGDQEISIAPIDGNIQLIQKLKKK